MDVMQAALRRIAGRLLGSDVTGGIKKYYFLCCFIRCERVNITIKCTINIRSTAQISIGGTSTWKCAFLIVIYMLH